MSEKVLSDKNKNFFVGLIKGAFVALCISVAFILLFAVVLKFSFVSDLVVKIVNQVIKVVSVFFGVKILLKNNAEKGILKGALLGAIYTVLCYLIFSLLSNSFSFGLSFVFDVLFSMVFGAVFGVFFANLRK